MITYGAGLTAVKPKIRWLINSSMKMIADTILKFTVPLPALLTEDNLEETLSIILNITDKRISVSVDGVRMPDSK